MLEKRLIVAMLLLALTVSVVVPLVSAAQPPIDTTTLYRGITAISRIRFDPKRAYDTASGEAIMNSYETLITTQKEDHTKFVPLLATEWGKDITGLYGGTPEQPVWWFKLRFTNATGQPILFHPWEDRNGVLHANDELRMEDVLWSFKLGLVQDLGGSPMWMFWLPLFETMGMPYRTNSTLLSNLPNEIDSKIWAPASDVIAFKLAFDFPDTAWLQILSQTWASIINKRWAVERGCWDGTWQVSVTGESVGTGDGTTTRFYIPKYTMSDGQQKVKCVVPGSETIYINGVPTTAYTMIYLNGTIDFNTPPPVGATITADYTFNYFYLFRRWPGGLYSYGPIDVVAITGYPQAIWDAYRMCGTGPYKFTTLDMVNKFYREDAFDNYWRGWATSTTQPGHLKTIITSWADGLVEQWPSRLAKFKAGDYDIIAVPRDSMFDLFREGWNINDPKTWLPIDGVYAIKDIVPVIAVDAIHMVFTVDPNSTYLGTGKFPNGIPPDFFANVHVRKAFAYMFNFTKFIRDAYYGEADQPATWAIRGLNPDYALTNLTKWAINLELAKQELQQAIFTQDTETKSAWEWGFYFKIAYNSGNKPRQTMCYLIQDALDKLSIMYGATGHFSCDIVEVDWGTYLELFETFEMPIFTIGWLQDFSDPDNFARPYMHSEGDFAYFQGYNNPEVDQLIEWGIHNSTFLPGGIPNPKRRYCYERLQIIYMQEVPSFVIDQARGRHFRRTWYRGWYYNALWPGNYFYDYWKQDGGIDTVTDQVNVVCDIYFDNKVDMKDIGVAIKAFGSTPGASNWNYHADVAQSLGDRKIDMKDIGYVVSKYGWIA